MKSLIDKHFHLKKKRTRLTIDLPLAGLICIKTNEILRSNPQKKQYMYMYMYGSASPLTGMNTGDNLTN